MSSDRVVGNPEVKSRVACLNFSTDGCPSFAQNPKPAGPGRERDRCLRQGRVIKARDSAMLAT
jgi:hypothetical protein